MSFIWHFQLDDFEYPLYQTVMYIDLKKESDWEAVMVDNCAIRIDETALIAHYVIDSPPTTLDITSKITSSCSYIISSFEVKYPDSKPVADQVAENFFLEDGKVKFFAKDNATGSSEFYLVISVLIKTVTQLETPISLLITVEENDGGTGACSFKITSPMKEENFSLILDGSDHTFFLDWAAPTTDCEFEELLPAVFIHDRKNGRHDTMLGFTDQHTLQITSSFPFADEYNSLLVLTVIRKF